MIVCCYERFLSHPSQFIIRHLIIIAFQKSWCNVLLLQGMPDLPWGGRCWGKSRGCNGLGIPLESPRIPAAAPSAAVPHASHGRYVVLVICAVASEGNVSNAVLQILRSRRQTHRTATVCDFFLIILCCEYDKRIFVFLKKWSTNWSANGCCDLLTTSVRKPIDEWFPKCASRIPRDPRPVPRGSVNTFL